MAGFSGSLCKCYFLTAPNYSMEFFQYEELPRSIQEKVLAEVAERKAAQEKK